MGISVILLAYKGENKEKKWKPWLEKDVQYGFECFL